MKQIDDYINLTFRNIKGSQEEIKGLKEEMRTHLIETVKELQSEGKTMDESVSSAISRFGKDNQLNSEIKAVFNKNKISLKKVLMLSLPIFLITVTGLCFLLARIKQSPASIVHLQPIDKTENFTVQKTSVFNSESVPPKIVIYTPHPYEKYTNSYESVDDISRKLADKLSACNISCEIIESPYINRMDAYASVKKFIRDNIENYSQKIILDLHRDGPNEKYVVDSGIAFIIGKGNESFKSNEKFAKELQENIKKFDPAVSTTVHLVNLNEYNQELSPKALRIQIGMLYTKPEMIEKDLEVLTHSLADVLQGNS